jgi:NAD(P)-dependent dehydrogenase (short-subunit alcohol dehydrogenase family)
MIAHVGEQFGRLNILVNNAGTSIRKPPEAYEAAEWHAVLDTNLTGAFLCSQMAHPIMKKGGGGKIINIGSIFALFGSGYAAHYAASKGALVQLTKSLAVAWAEDTSRSMPYSPAGSIPSLRAMHVSRSRDCTNACSPAPPPAAGVRPKSSPASPHSSHHQGRILSPAPRSRLMAAFPRWVERRHPSVDQRLEAHHLESVCAVSAATEKVVQL